MATAKDNEEGGENDRRQVVVNYNTQLMGHAMAAIGPNANTRCFPPGLFLEKGAPCVNQQTQVPSICSSSHEMEDEDEDDTSSESRFYREHTQAEKNQQYVDQECVENDFRTYCQQNELCGAYYQQKYGPQWIPKPSKGTLVDRGDEDSKCSIPSFLEDVEKSVKEFDKSSGPSREEIEQFLLRKMLPHLAATWGKSSSANVDVYKVLAGISHSRNSANVVKYTLHELQHLICRDNIEGCKENMLAVEKILRSTIISPEAVFKNEEYPNQRLRLSVYSRLLALLIVKQTQEDSVFPALDKRDLKQLEEQFTGRNSQIVNYRKKDRLRYSVEFIQKAINAFKKPHHKSLQVNLDQCKRALIADQNVEAMDLEFLRKLKKSSYANQVKNGKWFLLHIILCYLHGKVHSERSTPRMQTERRAMILLRLVVEAYQEGGGGDDWRFCLLAASILSDIVLNNVTKEIGTEACGCLVSLLKNEKVQKNPICRSTLEHFSSRMMFSPDSPTKTMLVHHLYKVQRPQYILPPDIHIKRLSWVYRHQSLEMNSTILSRGVSLFVKHGVFQRKKVAVKVLFVRKQDILNDNCLGQSDARARDRLTREAYNLARLNRSDHPNIPVLLSYDTESLPCHMIVQYERFGNLLQFVQRRRERKPLVSTGFPFSIFCNITEGLQYLRSLGLVHRAVMAENVLVGDNHVCKLSGLHSLHQIERGRPNNTAGQYSLYEYCSGADGLGEFISTTSDEDLPTRWKAPECILDHRYSTASDIWAFGVLMYEVLTLGCSPYRELPDDDVTDHVLQKNVLPREACFQEDEYNLMTSCWQWHRDKRITLTDLKRSLEMMQQLKGKLGIEEEKPRPNPPPLSYVACGREDTYETVPVCDSDPRVIPCKEEMRLNEVLFKAEDLPVNQSGKDGPEIKERISDGDKQHLRRLLGLNNPNLVPILKIANLESQCSIVEMITPVPHFGSLKEYVLNRRCQEGTIVTFLSQVASAQHYLHVNHIVHGDLRADHVNVVAPDKVQVCRLGRSKPLCMSVYEVNSTSCVIEAAVAPDAIRWSAPEVILEGHYMHASDVWSFGILMWELYTAFTAGPEHTDLLLPYCNMADHEILPHIREHGPLHKPDSCPDWMYIMMHQCWPYDPVQRPPFIALVDCLTSREPMNSWMMTLWLKQHNENSWPDLSVTQPENACHVTNNCSHPSQETIEKMCPEGFFSKHQYKYVQKPSAPDEDDDDLVYSEAAPDLDDVEYAPNDRGHKTTIETSYFDNDLYLCPIDAIESPYDDVTEGNSGTSIAAFTQTSPRGNDTMKETSYTRLHEVHTRNPEYQPLGNTRKKQEGKPAHERKGKSSIPNYGRYNRQNIRLPEDLERGRKCEIDEKCIKEPSNHEFDESRVENGNIPRNDEFKDAGRTKRQSKYCYVNCEEQRKWQLDYRTNLYENEEQPCGQVRDENRAVYGNEPAKKAGKQADETKQQSTYANCREQRTWQLDYKTNLYENEEQPCSQAPDQNRVQYENVLPMNSSEQDEAAAIEPGLGASQTAANTGCNHQNTAVKTSKTLHESKRGKLHSPFSRLLNKCECDSSEFFV